MQIPIYLDVFLSPIRDSVPAQVAICAALLLICADIVFGVIGAAMRHEFSSQKMREGIGHKCAELGLLFVGLIADGCLLGGVDLGFKSAVLPFAAGYVCVMEIGSLMEIFARMNPELKDSPAFKLLEISHKTHDQKEA